jgi:hypothetical protein
MSSSTTQSSPPGYELVKIDKEGFKPLFRKFLDRTVFEKRWNLDDKEFEQWLRREDFAYKGRKWKEICKSGAKIVGEDSEISTVLSKEMPAAGIDLEEIRTELRAGRLKTPATPKKPPPK